MGCDDFLSKPFLESDIFKKMHQHLGLDFIFEDTDNAIDSGCRPETLPRQEDIIRETEKLPWQWKRAMKEVADLSNHEEMCALTAQINARHCVLADKIQKELDLYKYDEILNIFQME